jgi:serine/threonine protein kinase
MKWRNELEGSEMDSATKQRTTRADGELDADEEVENFVDLLRVMLRWDPTDRPTAADLLTHHWFATSSSLASELWSGEILLCLRCSGHSSILLHFCYCRS